MQGKTSLTHHLGRFWRGTVSAASGLALPLGSWWLGDIGRHAHPDRLPHGLAIVLPGIEGRGAFSLSMFRGIHDAGFPGAVLLWDWTTRLWPLFLFHLRAQRRNRSKAAALAEIIVAYQNDYPGRPVYLVGHSGGAAMAAWTLEALPKGRAVTAAAMLGPALSPTYSLVGALQKVRHSVWNFWSPFDLVLLGAATLIFGTADRRHSISAGLSGFAVPHGANPEVAELYRTRLRQRRYELRMARQFNLGGHYGCANRVFVAEEVAPLLFGDNSPIEDDSQVRHSH